MIDRRGEETSKWLFNAASGHFIDTVGSLDSLTEISIDYNPARRSAILNGVDSLITFPSGIWVPGSGDDYCGYLIFRYLDTPNILGRLLTSNPLAGAVTALSWVGTEAPNGIHRFEANGGTGTTAANFNGGRLINNTEINIYMFAYEASSAAVRMAVESNEGIKGTTTNTEAAGLSVDTGTQIGADKADTSFTSMEVFQLGAFNQKFYSLSDLEVTGTLLLAEYTGDGDGSGIVPRAVPVNVPFAVPKVA